MRVARRLLSYVHTKLLISFIAALSLGLAGTAPASDYTGLVAMGYRWVSIHGPYASTTQQGVRRITAHRTDATDLLMRGAAGLLTYTGNYRPGGQRGSP